MATYSKTISLTVAGVEGDVVAEFNYSPATPDVMYLPNGDPGYPGDPEEIELTALWFGKANKEHGIEVLKWLNDEQITAIEEAILQEGPDEDEGPDYEEREPREYDDE